MAARKGFEPLTSGLGNRCSILLSYRAVAAFTSFRRSAGEALCGVAGRSAGKRERAAHPRPRRRSWRRQYPLLDAKAISSATRGGLSPGYRWGGMAAGPNRSCKAGPGSTTMFCGADAPRKGTFSLMNKANMSK